MGIQDKAEQAKGKLKEEAGRATNDPELEQEGKDDKASGKLKDAVDQAGDKVNDAIDSIKDRLNNKK